jgi:hypothetical protein
MGSFIIERLQVSSEEDGMCPSSPASIQADKQIGYLRTIGEDFAR